MRNILAESHTEHHWRCSNRSRSRWFKLLLSFWRSAREAALAPEPVALLLPPTTTLRNAMFPQPASFLAQQFCIVCTHAMSRRRVSKAWVVDVVVTRKTVTTISSRPPRACCWSAREADVHRIAGSHTTTIITSPGSCELYPDVHPSSSSCSSCTTRSSSHPRRSVVSSLLLWCGSRCDGMPTTATGCTWRRTRGWWWWRCTSSSPSRLLQQQRTSVAESTTWWWWWSTVCSIALNVVFLSRMMRSETGGCWLWIAAAETRRRWRRRSSWKLGVGVSSSSITIAIIPCVRAAAGTRAAVWYDPNQLISRVCKCARQCRHDSPEISHMQFPTTLHVAISSSCSYSSFESFPARSAPLQCQFPTESLSLIRRVRKLFHRNSIDHAYLLMMQILQPISLSLWTSSSIYLLMKILETISLSLGEQTIQHEILHENNCNTARLLANKLERHRHHTDRILVCAWSCTLRARSSSSTAAGGVCWDQLLLMICSCSSFMLASSSSAKPKFQISSLFSSLLFSSSPTPTSLNPLRKTKIPHKIPMT